MRFTFCASKTSTRLLGIFRCFEDWYSISKGDFGNRNIACYIKEISKNRVAAWSSIAIEIINGEAEFLFEGEEDSMNEEIDEYDGAMFEINESVAE